MTPYYDDGRVVLYHADCRDVIAELPDASVDVLLTDPPYASGARRDADRQVRGSMLRETDDDDWFSHDAMTTWGFTWFLRGILTDLRRVLKRGAHLYVFTDWRQQPNVYGMLEATGYRVNHSLVWDKEHYGMGAYWRNQHEHIVFASNGMPNAMLNRGMGSVLRCRTVPSEQRVHPTEKPLPLLRTMLQAIPGEVIFDPFAGSSTTLRAVKDVGKRGIGCEIALEHCESSAARLAQTVLLEYGEPPLPRAQSLPMFTEGENE